MTTETITISLPQNVTVPTGYRMGAYAGPSAYWVIRESDGAAVKATLRDDLQQVEEAGEGDWWATTADEVLEIIEGGFAELDQA